MKICSHCKISYPKTEEYFHKKVTKKGTYTSKKRTYVLLEDCISLRHICKKCHTINNNKKKQEKRAKELGLEVYDKKYSISINRLLYKESLNMSKNERIRYNRFKKSNMSMEDYNIHLSNYNKISIEKARNKRLEFLSLRLTLSEIPRCLAANRMRISIKDLNDETYIIYNKYIKFYRNVKNNKR